MWTIILIILAILYALNPFDLLPDLMLGWGWLDDIVILGLLWRYLYTQKKKRKAFQKYYQGQQRADDFSNEKPGDEKKSRSFNDFGDYSGAWDPYKILGIDRNAPAQEIKRAYRKLAGKYHPDKVEHLGDEFKSLAEKRFKDIQKAYDELRD